MMALFTLTLIITCLASPRLVLSQEVDSRSGLSNSEKVNVGDGQTRTIYSQRHISPHRMMHFGKRPLVPEPPTIPSPQAYDLYQPGKYPYLLHIELDQGQVLNSVPEEFQPSGKNIIYSYDYPQYGILGQSQQFLSEGLNLGNPFNGQKHARLISLSDPAATNIDQQTPAAVANFDDSNYGSPERAQPSSNEDNSQFSENGANKDNKINLNTRSSMQSGARGNGISLPKGFISNILYGRSSAPTIPNMMGVFNKKAEPKDNFFMHFGRK